ncbi:hypothetical protein GcM1_239031 [Golovinomyces cichoracearum]|uniref:Uncharacterized protein n=1 Tax=Golovinomyces cichoracearum TaxID=62708 RepID=A0A420IIN7_9PEZI|nr:hypothetical protein GcM1_239031 [Golovinomyces cichoracearum]
MFLSSLKASSQNRAGSRISKLFPSPLPELSVRENGKPPEPPRSARSAASEFYEIAVHPPNNLPPPYSDEDTPGLSHSSSDSSVEGEIDNLFESKIVESHGLGPNPLIASEKASTVILSSSTTLSRLPTSPSNSSALSEILYRRSAKKDRQLVLTELIPPPNKIFDHQQQATKQQTNRHHHHPSPQQKETDLSTEKQKLQNSITRKISPKDTSIISHTDLMGNKLAKLKNKNLGEFSSFSSHHEDTTKSHAHESRAISSHLQKTKPFISGTRKPPASTALSSYDEKAPPVPRKSSSRYCGLPSTIGSKPDSSSTLTSSPSSRSTTRAPTILTQPSSETLTLQSESILNLSTQRNLLDDKLPTINIITGPKQIAATELSEKKNDLTTIKLAPAPDITEETIPLGPPLNVVQFECYHNHQNMRKGRNKLCPVGCMICQKKDREMRWTCTWCYLSACADCTLLLSKTPGKDLRACLKKVQALQD